MMYSFSEQGFRYFCKFYWRSGNGYGGGILRSRKWCYGPCTEGGRKARWGIYYWAPGNNPPPHKKKRINLSDHDESLKSQFDFISSEPNLLVAQELQSCVLLYSTNKFLCLNTLSLLALRSMQDPALLQDQFPCVSTVYYFSPASNTHFLDYFQCHLTISFLAFQQTFLLPGYS